MRLTQCYLSLAVTFGGVQYGTTAIAGDAEEIRVHPELELYQRDTADYCEAGSLQVRVTVHGVTSQGIVKLVMYSGEKDFLKKKGKLRTVRVPAEESSQQICMNVQSPGEYAIVGYHDLDGNRRLKKKWDYTPLEPFGMSNNPKLKPRKRPKYRDSAFAVAHNGADINIFLIDRKKNKNKS